MPGRGPAPTPAAQRRRRNKTKDTPAKATKSPKPTKSTPAKVSAAATRDTSKRSRGDSSSRSTRDSSPSTSDDGTRARPPLELPETYRRSTWDNTLQEHVETTVAFLPETREWYEAYASAPIAPELTLVHWRALRRAAVLVDRFERGEHAQADAIRKIETNFGGSPYDQRRMGLDPGGVNPPDAPPAEGSTGGATVTDIRSRLSAPTKTAAKKR